MSTPPNGMTWLEWEASGGPAGSSGFPPWQNIFWTPSDPVTDEEYEDIYNSLTNPSREGTWGSGETWGTIFAGMLARHIYYTKGTGWPNPPQYVNGALTKVGGCGSPGVAPTSPSTAQIAGSIAAQATASVPVVGQLVSVFNSVLSIFGSAHAEAAAQEQADLCAAATAVNAGFDQCDVNVASGAWNAEQASQALSELYQEYLSYAQPVNNGQNEATILQSCCEALIALRNYLYSQAKPVTATSVAAASTANKQKWIKYGLVGGAVAAGALLIF